MRDDAAIFSAIRLKAGHMISTKSILHEKAFLCNKTLTISKVLLIKCKTLETVNEEWERGVERVKVTKIFKIWGGESIIIIKCYQG